MSPAVEVLDNGLRLVHAEGTSPGVAHLSVHVGVGFRAEPPGSDGLAHLFEHLMFAGSAHVAPGEHFGRIEAVGGRVGGHTRHDYTEYYASVPADSLGEVAALEADRLAGPRLNEASLATQVEVIAAEIAQQVEAVPFGGFPWRQLPAVMGEGPAHTHDGYGDVAALRRVDTATCAAFFDTWYDPRNMVVSVEGDLGADQLHRVRDALARVPARSGPAPRQVVVDEPAATADRHRTVHAANAPVPAWAAGVRLPDPVAEPALHAACTALATLLPAEHPDLRLSARSGWYAVPADARTPDAFVASTHPRPGVRSEQMAALLREALGAFTDVARPPRVLRTASARLRHLAHQRAQRDAHRARRHGTCVLLFDDADLDARIDPVRHLDPDLLAAAARHLVEHPLAAVLLLPAAGAGAVA